MNTARQGEWITRRGTVTQVWLVLASGGMGREEVERDLEYEMLPLMKGFQKKAVWADGRMIWKILVRKMNAQTSLSTTCPP